MRFVGTCIEFAKSSKMFSLDIVSLNNRLGYESWGYLGIFVTLCGYTRVVGNLGNY